MRSVVVRRADYNFYYRTKWNKFNWTWFRNSQVSILLSCTITLAFAFNSVSHCLHLLSDFSYDFTFSWPQGVAVCGFFSPPPPSSSSSIYLYFLFVFFLFIPLCWADVWASNKMLLVLVRDGNAAEKKQKFRRRSLGMGRHTCTKFHASDRLAIRWLLGGRAVNVFSFFLFVVFGPPATIKFPCSIQISTRLIDIEFDFIVTPTNVVLTKQSEYCQIFKSDYIASEWQTNVCLDLEDHFISPVWRKPPNVGVQINFVAIVAVCRKA